MLPSLAAMLFVLGTPPDLTERPSYLFHMQTGPDQKIHLTGTRYRAQPGDLVLFDSHDALTAKMYAWSGTGRSAGATTDQGW